MRKWDLLIPGAAIVVALIFMLSLWKGGGNKLKAVVTVDGREFASFPLSEDKEIVIHGALGMDNTLVIREGKAAVTDSKCPDKLCVYQGPIERPGQMIVCLPNRVVVEIKGDADESLDAVAR